MSGTTASTAAHGGTTASEVPLFKEEDELGLFGTGGEIGRVSSDTRVLLLFGSWR